MGLFQCRWLRVGLVLVCGLLGWVATQAESDKVVDAVSRDLSAIEPPTQYDNLHLVRLSSDKHASEYLIFIKQGVKAHIHERHSETLYIISGSGEMRLGDEMVVVEGGSFIKVPEGVVHGVTVTSSEPLVALSVQAPEFKGQDRVFVE